jgi:hypothetical protein
MMRKIYLLFVVLFLVVSCNNDMNLQKEISMLEKQNDSLKKRTPDSMSIYNVIRENRNQQFAEKFVDSLRKNNPKLLDKIGSEIYNTTEP